MFIVYLISGIAETNRAPFDVVEGESEIVAGHMVEYSGMAFRVVLPRGIREHDPYFGADIYLIPRWLAFASRILARWVYLARVEDLFHPVSVPLV
jgi:hypothetical protein